MNWITGLVKMGGHYVPYKVLFISLVFFLFSQYKFLLKPILISKPCNSIKMLMIRCLLKTYYLCYDCRRILIYRLHQGVSENVPSSVL